MTELAWQMLLVLRQAIQYRSITKEECDMATLKDEIENRVKEYDYWARRRRYGGIL